MRTMRRWGPFGVDERLGLTRRFQRAKDVDGQRGWVMAVGGRTFWFLPLPPSDRPWLPLYIQPRFVGHSALVHTQCGYCDDVGCLPCDNHGQPIPTDRGGQ